jgi:hypothetical protein
MQSQWKLSKLQFKTWGSSTCVHYFPSICRFELMSVRHGVCRHLGYCDGWRSKIIHQNWNFMWQKPFRNSHCLAWSVWWADSGLEYSFQLGYSFLWRTCQHKWWPKARKAKNINNEQSVKLVANFLAEHRSLCLEISQGTRMSPTSVFCILTND